MLAKVSKYPFGTLHSLQPQLQEAPTEFKHHRDPQGSQFLLTQVLQAVRQAGLSVQPSAQAARVLAKFSKFLVTDTPPVLPRQGSACSHGVPAAQSSPGLGILHIPVLTGQHRAGSHRNPGLGLPWPRAQSSFFLEPSLGLTRPQAQSQPPLTLTSQSLMVLLYFSASPRPQYCNFYVLF